MVSPWISLIILVLAFCSAPLEQVRPGPTKEALTILAGLAAVIMTITGAVQMFLIGR